MVDFWKFFNEKLKIFCFQNYSQPEKINLRVLGHQFVSRQWKSLALIFLSSAQQTSLNSKPETSSSRKLITKGRKKKERQRERET